MGELQLEDGVSDLRGSRHAKTANVTLEDGSVAPVLDKDEHGGNILRTDPVGHGIVQYENGVTAYMLNSGREPPTLHNHSPSPRQPRPASRLPVWQPDHWHRCCRAAGGTEFECICERGIVRRYHCCQLLRRPSLLSG